MMVALQVPLNTEVTCIIPHYKKFRQIQLHVKNLFPCPRYIDEVPFFMFWNSNEYTPKALFYWRHMLNAFVSTYEAAFSTTHGHNKTRTFDTEGFLTVSSLCGAVCSPSIFTKYLIGTTVNISSILCINANIYIHQKPVRAP